MIFMLYKSIDFRKNLWEPLMFKKHEHHERPSTLTLDLQHRSKKQITCHDIIIF
jgi:hypothetical protein